jgi:cyclopropane fatty-acyl-phospholipid synthase-like methyltransferase
MTTIDYEPALPVYKAMQTEILEGRPLASWVGGGDALAVALSILPKLVEHATLGAGQTVLDIGCGCGRIAAGLTQHLGPAGRYVGVDLVPSLVNFCIDRICPLHPGFQFITLAVPDSRAPRDISQSRAKVITDLGEAYRPGDVDLCLATSLFTHVGPATFRSYLAHIGKALKPDGRAYITAFLIDPTTREVIECLKPNLTFRHVYEEEGFYLEDPAMVWHAVGVSFEMLRRIAADADLYVERVLFGRWPGRPSGADYQDIVVLRKVPRNSVAA